MSTRLFTASVLALGVAGLGVGCGTESGTNKTEPTGSGASTGTGTGAAGTLGGTGGYTNTGPAGTGGAYVPPPPPSGTNAPPPPPVNNVSFDWAVSQPGSAAPCQPGLYCGAFECNFAEGVTCDSNPGLGTPTSGIIPYTGPIQITFAKSQNGEFLDVAQGELGGLSAGFAFGGPITGSLNCSTQEFAGDIAGGYKLEIIPGLPFIEGNFQGPMVAGYDPFLPGLTYGEWCMTMTQPGNNFSEPCAAIPTGQAGSCQVGSCKGKWGANWTSFLDCDPNTPQ